jgi:hypothetical protein
LAEIVERIAGIEAQVNNLDGWMESHERKQNGSLEKIEKRLECIERNLNGRPTWAVSALVTFMSSVSVGLAVYFLAGR